jgi:glycine betaine/proline transport system ATP-binding protein
VRDNVGYGLEVRQVPKKKRYEIVDQVLSVVQLSGWEDRFPEELSGGMQQRVGLARALAVDPTILLMDEPFSALDPLIRRQLQEEFLNLLKAMNKTTIFITHDFEEAIRLGARIGIMRDGRFVQIGTPHEIISRPIDSYVSEFGRGISRLLFIRAELIMTALVDRDASERADWLRVDRQANLEELTTLSALTVNPLVVVDDLRRDIGIITREQIIRSVQMSIRPATPPISLATDKC